MKKPNLGPRFLIIFCCGYSISLLLDYGGSFLPYLSVAMIGLAIIFGLTSASGKSSANAIIVISLIFPLAAINSLISTNQTDTSLKWLLWIAAVFGLSLMAQRSGPSIDEDLYKKTAIGFFIIWVFLAIRAYSLAETSKEKTTALHLSAFYANLLISTALFMPNKFFRIILVIIGVVGALTSGSRAAFLFLPLVFLPGLAYHYKAKISSIFSVALLVVALYFISQNETLNALTFGKKGAEITNFDSLELAERSAGGRAELREIGLEYIINKPWGYGYGQSFEVVLDGKSLGNNLHNGYLNVAAQMGVHIFLIYTSFLFWIYFKLITNRTISRQFRFFVLSVLSCVFLRAVSESFSLFDLGHPAAFFSIFLISLFVTRLRSQHS